MAEDTATASGSTDDAGRAAVVGGDWPARAADLVEDVVTAVHDRVVRPLLLVGRAAVFGVIIATMALVLAVLLAVSVVRLLDNYAFGHRAWASEALVGGLITIVGLLFWSFRRPRGADDNDR